MTEPATRVSHLEIPGIELQEAIGRGGFATVYQGWQTEFHRTVAVKVLDATTDESATHRFSREIRAMGAVSDHPHVVPVYAVGTVDDRPYLVMPLLAGGSLADELANGPLEPAAVIELGRTMADALAAAHRVGLLHRDVKPANILRTGYGQHQLADFGIARFVDSTMTHGDLLATVAFAAPEVLAGKPATAASDVYSLGATLHAALSGEAPFSARAGEEPIALAVRVMSQPPAALDRPDLPAGLAAVIERAMAKEAEVRFGSAEELRDALAGLSVASPPPAVELTSVVPPAVEPSHATATMPVPERASAPVERPVVAPQAVQAAPSAERAAPRPAAGHRQSSGGRRIVLLALLAAVLGVAGVLYLVSGREPAPRPPAPVAATTPTSQAAPVPSGDEASAVRRYYALLDEGRVDEGFAWLSPAYQRRTGESSYRGFWRTIRSVEVLDVVAGDGTARATLRYTRTNGTISTERATLRFVPDAAGTGRLLIDDYNPG